MFALITFWYNLECLIIRVCSIMFCYIFPAHVLNWDFSCYMKGLCYLFNIYIYICVCVCVCEGFMLNAHGPHLILMLLAAILHFP